VDAEWRFLQGTSGVDPMSDVLKSLLRPGDVFVDVGANVGYFTLLGAKLGAEVVAFEPTPAVFQRLQENVALNRLSARLMNAAVMDKSQELMFYFSRDDAEANNLFGEGEGEGCIKVSAVALDDHVKRADVLKIDAEGAEPFVLDGAQQLISGSRPAILIEVNAHSLKNAGFTPEDVYSRLRAYGYKTEVIESGVYKGLPIDNVFARA
jgi:FkbM family methyltransferase